jgi:hypothetical protein
LLKPIHFDSFPHGISSHFIDGGFAFLSDHLHQVIPLASVDLAFFFLLIVVRHPNVEIFVFWSSYFFDEVVLTELIGDFVDKTRGKFGARGQIFFGAGIVLDYFVYFDIVLGQHRKDATHPLFFCLLLALHKRNTISVLYQLT